jgi:hypothetical protein
MVNEDAAETDGAVGVGFKDADDELTDPQPLETTHLY